MRTVAIQKPKIKNNFVQLQFIRINLSDHSFKVRTVDIQKVAKKLKVELKTSIISACVSYEGDPIKSLS